MKIGLIHISDFHLEKKESINSPKFYKMVAAIKSNYPFDEMVITFTGDLTNHGTVDEYKIAFSFMSALINKLKIGHDKFIPLFLIPGNHDLLYPDDCRSIDDIKEYVANGTLDNQFDNEMSMLKNFYDIKFFKVYSNHEKLVKNCTQHFDGINLQFNLVNTAPFSLKDRGDKGLHHFPQTSIGKLERKDEKNICITMMHHNFDWFDWESKNLLEKYIYRNSDIVMFGHDHHNKTYNVGFRSYINTVISCCGEIDFNDLYKRDSFNVLTINSNNMNVEAKTYVWDIDNNLYCSSNIEEYGISENKNGFIPNPEFIKEMKHDTESFDVDYVDYYTFPKLFHTKDGNYGEERRFENVNDFMDLISEHKCVLVKGDNGSGKTCLLKYLFLSMMKEKIPLFLESSTIKKFNTNSIAKRLFNSQYSDENDEYQRFLQLSKERRVLLIDDFDAYVDKEKNKRMVSDILQALGETFGHIIITCSSYDKSIEDSIIDEITKIHSVYAVKIRPFYKEKRDELINKACQHFGVFDENEIAAVKTMTDRLVSDRPELFSLNPGYLIKYIKYISDQRRFNYSEVENSFGKVFEYDLSDAISKSLGKEQIDSALSAIYEIAGHMYMERKDSISEEIFRNIINFYSEEYGVEISPKPIVEVVINSGLMSKGDNLELYFKNKNHFAYLIAKYLWKESKTSGNNEGLVYALNNICFEINRDVILYFLYIDNDIQTIRNILDKLIYETNNYTSIDIDSVNMNFLRGRYGDVKAPSNKEGEKHIKNQESNEEKRYSNLEIEAKGVFDYDESKVRDDQNRLKISFICTEMICKAIPVFNSIMKKEEKQKLVKCFYDIPPKLVYEDLKHLDKHYEEIRDAIIDSIKNSELDDSIKNSVDKQKIDSLFKQYGIAYMLSCFDYYTGLCSSYVTKKLLLSHKPEKSTDYLLRLMIADYTGDSDMLNKEANEYLKNSKYISIHCMKLIIRKHILTSNNISFNDKQKLIDNFFPKQKKTLLTQKK